MSIKYTATLFLTCGMLACADSAMNTSSSNQTGSTSFALNEQAAISGLQWLDSADPEADAKLALSNNKKVLYSMGGRGANPPGVAAGNNVTACTIEVISGASDMVYGDIHLNYLQKARRYAQIYNRVILKSCVTP